MRLPLLALGAALGLSACSGPAAPPSRATLEARVAASPDDVEALRDLGAFLAVDEQYGPALGPLTRARDLDPGDGQTLYLIGLVNEALERPDAAEDAYAGYLGVDADDTYRDSLRSRLDALVRQRLQTQFSAALVTEDTLADVTGTGAVGVLPFAYRGDNAEYAAIGRGLAEVVSVDLAATELDVVERIRLQALLAEYDLAREGLLDPATAPRAGRLLGADRLVGGEVDIQGEQLRIESAVWEGQLRDVTTAEGGLPELFRIQKETTLGVLTALGVEVTEAERAEILRVPTEDLVAFLLYSRALRREDRGDFLGAVQLYDEALARDPSFGLAARGRTDARLSVSARRPARPTLVATAQSEIVPPELEATGIVRQRANRLRESIGSHTSPSEETREPTVEGNRAGVLGPISDPPPPPPRGGNQP